MGLQQSPVNLQSMQTSSQLRPLLFSFQATKLDLRFDGRQLTASPRKSISLKFQQKTFDWQKMVIHSPSEHQIDHVNSDLELQLEFAERETGERLHLAIFASEGQAAQGSLMQFARLPSSDKPKVTWELFQLQDWLPPKLSYIYYEGSQSYPPCQEKLTWLVLREAVKIEHADLQRLAALVDGKKRPLQPLGQRVPLLSR